MAVPMRADIGRQDRPGHVGEAAREERRGQFDDVMLRLEPGDEVRLLLAADFAEADKGCILCSSRRTAFAIAATSATSGSVAIVKQIVVAAQPPQQAIEQGEPLGVAVQDRGPLPVRRIWPVR